MPNPSAAVKPVLVYWHCDCYWPLALGPSCPMTHDDGHVHRARKRRVWLCQEHGSLSGAAYFSRKEYLNHDPEECYPA